METTTHSTSKGNVLPSTDHDNDDFEELSREGDDTPRAALTFEQRTIRTLLSFERKRLAMQRTELAMEEVRFSLHREQVISERINRSVLFEALAELVKTQLPVVFPLLLEQFGLNAPEVPAAAEKEPIVPEWHGEAARPKAESPRAAFG